MLARLLLAVLVSGLVQASPNCHPTTTTVTKWVTPTKPAGHSTVTKTTTYTETETYTWTPPGWWSYSHTTTTKKRGSTTTASHKTCSHIQPSCSASIRSQCARCKTVTVTPHPVTKTTTVTAGGKTSTDRSTSVTTTTVYTTQTLTSPISTDTITITATTDTTDTQLTTEFVTNTVTSDVTATSSTSQAGPNPEFKRRHYNGGGSCSVHDTSSACSCLGVTGSTVTKTLAASTITRTATSFVNSTTTIRADSTVTVTETATTIDRSPATTSTTTTESVTTTSTIATTTTTTTTSTNTASTTTVTTPYSAPTPACNRFQLRAVGSQYDGFFVEYDGSGNQVLAFDQSSGIAGVFTIAPSGELFLTQLNNLPVCLGARSFRNAAENVYAATPGNDPRTGNNYTPLVCNAGGTYLSCYSPSGQPGAFSVYTQGNRLTLSPAGPPPDLFTSIRLLIVPAC